MKQIKVYNTAVSSNDYFTASFSDTVTIEPGSRVMFDKISFTISTGDKSQITFPDQTILINNVANEPLGANRAVVIPGGTYNTLTDLMNAMNRAFAASLDSDPLYDTNYQIESDVGLAYYNEATGSSAPYTYVFAYDQSQLEIDTTGDLTNMIPVTQNDGLNSFAVQTIGTNFSYISPSPLVRGGLSASTSLLAFDTNACPGYFDIGLYSSPDIGATLLHGIRWDGVAKTLSYVNNGSVTSLVTNTPNIFNNTTPDPLVPGNPGLRIYWYMSQGQLRFCLNDMSDADPVNWTRIVESPLGTYAGYDVNLPHFFQINGNLTGGVIFYSAPQLVFDKHTPVNNTGYYTDISTIGTVKYLPKVPRTVPLHAAWFPVPDDNIITRSIRLDFTAAGNLITGLGLIIPVLQSVASFDGVISASKPIGFVSFTELELDILDFPLESYLSVKDSNYSNRTITDRSGRVNAVTFFTPSLLNPTGSVSQYIFSNLNMPFINIKNEFQQVVESMTFRLFNPASPTTTIQFHNLSFNFYIQSEKDGIAIAFA